MKTENENIFQAEIDESPDEEATLLNESFQWGFLMSMMSIIRENAILFTTST